MKKKLKIIQFITEETIEILNKKKEKTKLRSIEIKNFINENTIKLLSEKVNYDGMIYTFSQFNFDELPDYKKKRKPKFVDGIENLFGWSLKNHTKKLIKKVQQPTHEERMQTLDLIQSETRKKNLPTVDKLNIYYNSTVYPGWSIRTIEQEPLKKDELEKKEDYNELTLRLIFDETSDTDLSDWDVERYMFRGEYFAYASDDDLENSDF